MRSKYIWVNKKQNKSKTNKQTNLLSIPLHANLSHPLKKSVADDKLQAAASSSLASETNRDTCWCQRDSDLHFTEQQTSHAVCNASVCVWKSVFMRVVVYYKAATELSNMIHIFRLLYLNDQNQAGGTVRTRLVMKT